MRGVLLCSCFASAVHAHPAKSYDECILEHLSKVQSYTAEKK
jgi:hypothetical protein